MKKYINMNQPKLIQLYNNSMGGVDQADQNMRIQNIYKWKNGIFHYLHIVYTWLYKMLGDYIEQIMTY